MPIIGIDVNGLTRAERTGTELYLLNLLQEMKKIELPDGVRIRLYAEHSVPELENLPSGWELRPLPWKGKAWTHIRLSAELMWNSPDILFVPIHEIPLFTGSAKIVTTIHDIAFTSHSAVYSAFGNLRQKWALRRAKRKADRIIAISRATADELARHAGIINTEIIPHAGHRREAPSSTEISEAQEKYAGGKPYFFFLGRIEEKKNIPFLIEAFKQAKEDGALADAQLLLAGKDGYGAEAAHRAASECADVKILGYISDTDAAALLAGARAFVFPSRAEGFGLPLLEAMDTGTPVLASDIPVLREVAGPAALYFDPKNQEECISRLEEMYTSTELRARLIELGNERRELFTWEASAKKTLETILSVL
jgi:glycosyltransferase involved in cell wall biosynthesis